MPVWRAGGVAKAFGAIAGVVVIGRYLTRPLLRIIAATNLREVFTAFALLLVIGIAQLMSLAGVSMALGAFLAGVLLASSEYRHALETDIEPFKGLLLGLFFISVGMSIDFGLLRSRPLLVAGLVLRFPAGSRLAMLWLVARGSSASTAASAGCSRCCCRRAANSPSSCSAPRAPRASCSSEWDALLTMAVALSMAATPLLLILHDWWICPDAKEEREADAIDEPARPVIIAGFGRFGQIVGRLLGANSVRAVVLDHDPDQIETVRKFGYKVFYGDATRLDLLRAAGAAKARLLINAIDDVEDSLALTDLVREHFPEPEDDRPRAQRFALHRAALARRGDHRARDLRVGAARGPPRARGAGSGRFRARDMANIFRRHNIRITEEMIAHFDDDDRLVSAAKAGRDELEQQFARDRAQFEREHSSKGWH